MEEIYSKNGLYKRFNSEKGMIVIKKYRDKYKLTWHKCLRLKGYVEIDRRDRIEVPRDCGKNGESSYSIELMAHDNEWEYTDIECYVDDLTGEEYYTYNLKPVEIVKEKPEKKLANNIIRAKAHIYELAICNDWDYFCTFTIDKTKYDRYDLRKFHIDFTRMIRNLNRKDGYNIKYLLIPEMHKDGAWHMHGLLSGLPDQEVRAFDKKEHLPLYIIEKLINNESIFSWSRYQNKFGFCDLENIKDIHKVSAYITKYISKELSNTITECNAHMYYASQKLKRAEVVERGFLEDNETDGFEYQFENDYVKTAWITEEEYNFLQDFIDKK